MSNKIKSLPGVLRVVILLVQVAGWITMAAALQNNSLNFSVSNTALTNVLIARILYLVVFVIGSVISVVVLALGLFDRSLGPVMVIVILDFTWAVAECGVSIMSALVEAYVAGQSQVNNTFFTRPNYYNWWYIFVTNRGAFAVAAGFGFTAAILSLISGLVLSCPKSENTKRRSIIRTG